jgi:hypothetical protein
MRPIKWNKACYDQKKFKLSMDRRTALKYTTSLLGMSIIGAEAFLAGCAGAGDELFTPAEVALFEEIAETILPDTERSPGAKAAGIGAFMQTMVRDCYSSAEQAVFRDGLTTIDTAASSQYGRAFTQLSPAERLEVLKPFDRQARAEASAESPHFFGLMKQLTILGYFTSQPGVTQAMRYDPVPGSYDGCAEYSPGDRAWYGPLSSIG